MPKAIVILIMKYIPQLLKYSIVLLKILKKLLIRGRK